MKTVRIRSTGTPNSLRPFENKEIGKVILTVDTGIFEEDIVLYPAYMIDEKFDEVKKDLDELRLNRQRPEEEVH